ncbi:MAG: type II toxin-antitoxin system RelE/ParE family toxin [Pseudomonadota bacterium]|nr:type II toxin-antitoxin system RelE/ParE family toxin [Gammaproteobacteria bacterium]MDQ3582927.1 type II toxin-antitoxin system RelE/ParE family toxin [Pseudomonadota bacterium]
MVKWAPHARRQLRHIHDYIAQDSQHYAKQVTQELVQKSMTLDALPRIGRVVPELNDKTVREVSLYSYRIIYQIQPTHIGHPCRHPQTPRPEARRHYPRNPLRCQSCVDGEREGSMRASGAD